jgi:hypothetical protein
VRKLGKRWDVSSTVADFDNYRKLYFRSNHIPQRFLSGRIDSAQALQFFFPSTETANNYFWLYRTSLVRGQCFNKTKIERGLDWREYAMLIKDKQNRLESIAFGEVATHNHFVLERSGMVFKQTAPVIKLPPTATEDDHLGLLGLLNSSTACF